jgi:hypothetical protein
MVVLVGSELRLKYGMNAKMAEPKLVAFRAVLLSESSKERAAGGQAGMG